MQRAASDVMQSILLSAVIDALEAMKSASGGVPNNMLRDLQSIHRNTTFADLPKAVQDSIGQSVRAAFTQFLKEGLPTAAGFARGQGGAVRTHRAGRAGRAARGLALAGREASRASERQPGRPRPRRHQLLV